ncbi:hypothetical protein [Herbaspirillum frisingense]|uniref:Uncharacterized protein n=1 Tax=Herbaspirillum frisingense TaxID=92645 RepID=A0ABU1PDR6_9BURK|nr:hypothetical protein [Herbaspirillum frisingense]MDR6584056.1 hypothetical protein [Herbaspirillum frisingense]
MSELASSLSWALMTIARRQGVVIDSVRLNAAIAAAMKKSGGTSIDINSLCGALSLPKAQLLKAPDRSQLPVLGVVQERGWGLIVDQRPDGRWIFVSEEGHALISDDDLVEGVCKIDFSVLAAKGGQNGFERVFKEALAEFRPVFLEVVLASVVMSVIALGASIFSMQVYDRVIPTHGVATLIVLAIGVGLTYGYDSASRTLTIRKSNNAVLTGADVQAIIQAIKLGGSDMQDGVHTAQFSLVSSTGEVGGASTATLVVDSQAPTLDTDRARLGLQIDGKKLFSGSEMIAGDHMFANEFNIWPTSDIASIAVRMSGPQLDVVRDKLVLDTTLPLNINLPTVRGKVIGGISGLNYGYDTASRTLTITKSSGAALDDVEARAILKAIQLQNSTPSSGERSATVILTDKAGNSSQTNLTVTVDLTVPSSITAAFVPAKQASLRQVDIPDLLGDQNKHNLSPRENADLSSILNFGMNAQAFLASIRAILAEWGGINITGNANTTSANYYSVVSFSGLRPEDVVIFFHQAASSTRSGNFKFTTSGPSNLSLVGLATYLNPNTDLYEAGGQIGGPDNDIGNIRVLYQVTTNIESSTPTINVTYDGTKASIGDIIALYEGNKLLASATLGPGNIGSANTTLGLTADSSLTSGRHMITAKFIDLAGNTVSANDVTVTIAEGLATPTLTNLRVAGESGISQAINASPTKYAVISELPSDPTGKIAPEQNLSFSGTVGRAGESDMYEIRIAMGGRIMAFGKFKAGDFTLSTPANMLAPGLYKDFMIIVTNISDGVNNGQTTWIKDQTVAWYWIPQSLKDLAGGAGDDVIPLGVTANGQGTNIQTGPGKDTLVVGNFTNAADTSKLAATITDFYLGQDKVAIFGQTVTKANLDSYVKASSYGGLSTKLTIDLDGAGPGTTTYSLYLQNVQYNPNSIATIFGV